jgi:hypothetical protein
LAEQSLNAVALQLALDVHDAEIFDLVSCEHVLLREGDDGADDGVDEVVADFDLLRQDELGSRGVLGVVVFVEGEQELRGS